MLATSVRTALVALLLVGLLSLIVPTTTAKYMESAISTQNEEELSSSSASYSFFRSTSVNNGARGATGTSESHVLHIRKRLNCENCCKGIGSCANNQGKIGNGSCNAMGACANNEKEIGDNACSGSIGACANNQGVIGNGSCGGDGDVSPVEDDGSSVDESTKKRKKFTAGACANNQGNIGLHSCNETGSCADNGVDGAIGNGSCNGIGACADNDHDIGDNQCNSLGACASG